MFFKDQPMFLIFFRLCAIVGYGFVDFDSPTAAQKAVTALKSSGVQAQMAKVDDYRDTYSNKPAIKPLLLEYNRKWLAFMSN